MTDDDPWLETTAEIGDAPGPAAAHVLDSLAETLAEAPGDVRFDVQVEVEEVSGDA